MGDKSKIEWADTTWNPTTGCSRVSDGCTNCYAVRMTKRLARIGQKKYTGLINPEKDHFNGRVKYDKAWLDVPLKRKKSTIYFVNSMSDLFHDEVPFDFVDRVFAVMALCPQHIFKILTKRPERMKEYILWGDGCGRWGYIEGRARRMVDIPSGNTLASYSGSNLPNVHLGVSIENQEAAEGRIPHLLGTPAAVRFLSCEPLLGPVDLGFGTDHTGHRQDHIDGTPWPQCLDCSTEEETVDWVVPSGPRIHQVIVGGETGPGARAMAPNWARSIRDQCVLAHVAFFFKKMGGGNNSRLLDGRKWNEQPETYPTT